MKTPDTKHPRYATLSEYWTLCRDFFGGTRVVRAKGKDYLPKHAAEDEEDYQLRLKLAVVYNAFSRAVDAITGLAFQKDPTLGDDVGVLTREDWENIDMQGTHGDVFVRRLMTEGMITGYVGLLVDMPRNPGGLTLAKERQQGIRPYWVQYRSEQIINWRTGRMADGTVALTLLVLAEALEEPQDDFGTRAVAQYRVFRHEPGTQPTWQVWRPVQATGVQSVQLAVAEEGTCTTSRIPFVLAELGATTNNTWLDARPPLYDLAELNLAHYRLLSDRRNILHLSCVPILVEIGGSPPKPGQQERAIGPGVLVQIPNPDGDLKYVEPSGGGLGPTREELQDTERRMAQVSLAFLASETRAAETAEAKRIDSAAQNATLGSVIRSVEDAVEEALVFHAEYRKEQPGSITLNRDFEELQLTPELIKVLSDMVAVGQLDLDTFWELLKQGRILPAGFKADEVKARLLDNGDATVPSQQELDALLAAAAGTTPPEADPNAP